MSQSLLNEIELSSIPGKNDPRFFLWRYQQYLVKGLKVYLKGLSETFRLSLSPLFEKIENLDIKKRFSPALYTTYNQIKKNYDDRNIEALFLALQSLKNEIINPYAEAFTCSSFFSESWEFSLVSDLKNSTPGHEEEKKVFPLVHWNDQDFPPENLQESLDILKKVDKGIYQEFLVYVSRIKLLSSKLLIACTSPKFFGTIYMRFPHDAEDPLTYHLDVLSHEISHLHLYAMMGEEVMILNDEKELFSSPLRPDPRPMYGIFHAGFVLARIIRVLRAYKKMSGKADILSKKEKRFEETCRIIEEKAHLSESGKQLYQTFAHCAFED